MLDLLRPIAQYAHEHGLLESFDDEFISGVLFDEELPVTRVIDSILLNGQIPAELIKPILEKGDRFLKDHLTDSTYSALKNCMD